MSADYEPDASSYAERFEYLADHSYVLVVEGEFLLSESAFQLILGPDARILPGQGLAQLTKEQAQLGRRTRAEVAARIGSSDLIDILYYLATRSS